MENIQLFNFTITTGYCKALAKSMHPCYHHPRHVTIATATIALLPQQLLSLFGYYGNQHASYLGRLGAIGRLLAEIGLLFPETGLLFMPL